MQSSLNPTGAYCLVMTATASEAEAETLAQQIVQARLAACVQVPITAGSAGYLAWLSQQTGP